MRTTIERITDDLKGLFGKALLPAKRRGVTDAELIREVRAILTNESYETAYLSVQTRPDFVVTLKSTGELVSRNGLAFAMIRRIFGVPYPKPPKK